jgi:hypothetical protein
MIGAQQKDHRKVERPLGVQGRYFRAFDSRVESQVSEQVDSATKEHKFRKCRGSSHEEEAQSSRCLGV